MLVTAIAMSKFSYPSLEFSGMEFPETSLLLVLPSRTDFIVVFEMLFYIIKDDYNVVFIENETE